MKIQSVIIIRVTDLIRFFDIAEFWQYKEDFRELLLSDEYGCFFDNNEQKYLAKEVSEWLIDREPRVYLDNERLTINIDGEDHRIPLGRLSPFVQKCRDNHTLTEKQLKGLTTLYVMLGANQVNSDIHIQYNFFSSMRSGKGEFMPLFSDCNLTKSSESVPSSYRRSIIVNMNTPQSNKKITVRYGDSSITLEPMECMVGLFSNDDECIRLLPRLKRDYDGHTCSLVYNPSTKQPSLKIEKVEGVDYIDNVCCFHIEKGGYMVYLTQDGQLHYDADKCFTLNSTYSIFRKNRPNANILAFEVSSIGDYIFYTDQGLLR